MAHRSSRLLLASAVLAGSTLGLASTATAHVSPDKGEVPAGGYTDVQLLVPHGCDGEATERVDVQIPEAITSASPYVVAGWSVATETEALDEPIDDGHGGQITERDAVITWTAEDGNALEDGLRQDFGIGFRAPEDVGEVLYFKTIQTCASGTAEWIAEWDGEGEEPDGPAPAVLVVAAEDDGHGGADQDGEVAQASLASAESPAAAAETSSGASTALVAVALVAGLAGLGTGTFALARTRR